MRGVPDPHAPDRPPAASRSMGAARAGPGRASSAGLGQVATGPRLAHAPRGAHPPGPPHARGGGAPGRAAAPRPHRPDCRSPHSARSIPPSSPGGGGRAAARRRLHRPAAARRGLEFLLCRDRPSRLPQSSCRWFPPARVSPRRRQRASPCRAASPRLRGRCRSAKICRGPASCSRPSEIWEAPEGPDPNANRRRAALLDLQVADQRRRPDGKRRRRGAWPAAGRRVASVLREIGATGG